MGDFVASSSTLALADGWRPMGMAPPTRGLESGAREGRMTMDSHSHSFDLLATGEQGLSMSDHFLEEEEEKVSASPFLNEALHASFPFKTTAARTTARPALTSSGDDAESLMMMRSSKESSMAKNNSTSAAGAKLLFGALQVVSLMQLMSDAHSACPQGQIAYERIPGHRIEGFKTRTIREAVDPISLAQRCADLCRGTEGNDTDADANAASDTECGFFNFQPGFSLGRNVEGPVGIWTESECRLPLESADGQKTLLRRDATFDAFHEICLEGVESILRERCPEKVSVFTRIPGFAFKPGDAVRVKVSSREECQEKCLREASFVCRSASYDAIGMTCDMSRLTARSTGYSDDFLADKNFDYFENECLIAVQRCEGFGSIFLKEEGVQNSAHHDWTTLEGVSVSYCEEVCLDIEGRLPFYCRSFHFNADGQICLLSSGTAPNASTESILGSNALSYHEEVCLGDGDGNGDAEANDVAAGVAHVARFTSSFETEGGLEQQPRMLRFHNPDFNHGQLGTTREAFSRFRKHVLDAAYYAALTNVNLGVCLDECLRDFDEGCLSVIYDERTRECRLSRYNQGDRDLMYDAGFDYFESLRDEHDEGDQEDAIFDAKLVSTDIMARTPIVTSGISGERGSEDYYYKGYQGAYIPRDHNPNTHRPPPPRRPAEQRPPQPDGTSGTRAQASGGPKRPITKAVSTRRAGYDGKRQPRCSDGTKVIKFKQVRTRTRLRSQYIIKRVAVSSLSECEQECKKQKSFQCRSLNFMASYSATILNNCELSEHDTRSIDIANPAHFEQSDLFDFYQRETPNSPSPDCVDVSQTCSNEGMEFTLRTPDGFRGRIYTYKHYDRPHCYIRGNGGRNNVLRIPGADGYPDCGTEQFADTQTNIVVIQFNENIQTQSDLRYNLTCTYRDPGKAVVSSGFIGAGSGQPTPIEYLPAEHTLDSRVRLVIMYQGRPTSTIAVGDPLEFKLETQEGENLIRDIFATNVVAKDPYSSRTVELIDRNGCPVDPFVFPALGMSRDQDGLTTDFNAFKIPESNFLVFEATVNTCRNGCQPANCDGPNSRSVDSFGRRKRELREEDDGVRVRLKRQVASVTEQKVRYRGGRAGGDEDFNLKEIFRVYDSRDEISSAAAEGTQDDPVLPRELPPLQPPPRMPSVNNPFVQSAGGPAATVCVAKAEYYGLVAALFALLVVILILTAIAGACYRRASLGKLGSEFGQPSVASVIASGVSFGPKRSDMVPARGSFHQSRYPRETQQRFSYHQPDLNAPVLSREYLSEGRDGSVDASEPIYTDQSFFDKHRKGGRPK